MKSIVNKLAKPEENIAGGDWRVFI